jgi:hypothetical protein
MSEKVPYLTTNDIQKLLDENKELILTIVELQKENKMSECLK